MSTTSALRRSECTYRFTRQQLSTSMMTGSVLSVRSDLNAALTCDSGTALCEICIL